MNQMTDEELRLAIAEELGWKHCSDCCGKESSVWPLSNIPHIHDPSGDVKDLNLLPNYPTDIAAAMGLLIESGWQFSICDRDLIILVGTDFYAEYKEISLNGIARAICEAWLQARRSK